MTVNIW